MKILILGSTSAEYADKKSIRKGQIGKYGNMQDPTEKHYGDVGILFKYKYNNNNARQWVFNIYSS